MVFSSIPFLFFFLPLFLILYYILPKKLKNSCLLIFSLIFYVWGEPVYIFLMIFSTFINYIFGLLMDHKNKKIFLIKCIIINIFIIGYYKYSDFLINILNNILNLNINNLNLSLPIGISFFTFQALSYVVDVYKGEVIKQKNFLTLLTYICMFPQLIAGPIVRYKTVEAELKERKHSFKLFSEGMIRFLKGLFKKVLLANNIGILFNVISSDINSISLLTAWLGLLSFTFQIYFDFSGYSDMAIGLGKMLGFEFLENFNYPYMAKSITDFWRRWHISLSSFFRDYVYIPLGGSRTKKIINIRNILIVWLLTGIWHGADYNFLLWGLYYGILLLIEKFVLDKYINKLPNFVKHIYTIFLIMIGWLIFSFTDLNSLAIYFSKLFNLRNIIDNNFIYYFSNYFILIIICTICSIKFNIKIKENVFTNILYIIFNLILFLITISFLVSDTYNPFLYFRF